MGAVALRGTAGREHPLTLAERALGLALVAVCSANGLFRDVARRARGVHNKGRIEIWRA